MAPYGLHLPFGSLPGSVLILRMNVTVPMAMHGIGNVLDGATRVALSSRAASSSLGLAPEGAFLVVAAAATPRRLATPLALAALRTTVGLLRPVVTGGSPIRDGEGTAVVGPLTPTVSVLALDAARELISDLKVERRLQEVVHVQGPRGEGPGNSRQRLETAILTLTLHLGAVDGCAGRWRLPVHLRLHVVAPARRNRDRIHLLWRSIANIWAFRAAHSGAKARAWLGTAI